MSLDNIEKVEASLWEAADQLRANSKLTSSEYCMPVLGVIFLRHATNRYNAALAGIEADQAAAKMPKRALREADFLKRRALMLPKGTRYDEILGLPKGTNLGTALIAAMDAIEKQFEPLAGQLPKEYDRFENTLLEDLLKTFDSEELRTASGDVFGRIYEYFLMKFAMQGAQDNGEFFTPPSIVQTIVNVIEPEHGIVFDPACGSGGMFVQSSYFIEKLGQDTSNRVTFFGQEKTRTTIRLTKMNLAVHGLEGSIREANTFYEDVHDLYGKPSAYAFAERHDNLEAIYKKLTERRDTADVTAVLKELHRIVNQAVRTHAPTAEEQDERRVFDLSKLDIARLRDEFSRKARRKATVIQDIRVLVEVQISRMVNQNPQRMDYYRRYVELVADYNREKDRVTIEETFAQLLDLVAGLDAEQRRAVEEGLSEEELALFDLLKKEPLTKAEREQLKLASRQLLASLTTLIEPLDKWTQKAKTQADVEVFILDEIYKLLPTPPYSADEKEAAAKKAYAHVWQQSASGQFPRRVG